MQRTIFDFSKGSTSQVTYDAFFLIVFCIIYVVDSSILVETFIAIKCLRCIAWRLARDKATCASTEFACLSYEW